MHGFTLTRSFQITRPLLAILLTTLMLAGLLVTNTIRNLSREQEIMEAFLLDEGLTLIRSFEAGARTTMMHEMMSIDPPVVTLLQETAKVDRIAFITIITDDGTVVASAGSHDPTTDTTLTREVFSTGGPVTRLLDHGDKEPVFEVAAIFRTLPGDAPPMMHGRWMDRDPLMEKLEQGRAVIHIGLRTGEFIRAREQDFRHTLFMGSLLFLLGSAGFYFLFLYQGMRVTRATLANMRLYTRNIIESMPDGLITLDPRQRIVSCNPRAMEFMARDIEELKGKSPGELFADWPEDTLDATGGISSFAYTFIHADGSEIPVEISGSPLRDEQGRDLGAVLLLRDLREIRSMQAQLVRSQRLASLGRMAAGIAHEIRNPLGTLRGFAQYFGSRAKDDASREYSSMMVGEVDRLNTIISSLLQFSRPREPEFQQVEIGELLDKTSLLLSHDFADRQVELEITGNECGHIEADGDLLLQVLFNLLKNALAASSPGDRVTLHCEADGATIHLTVTDTGTGMDRREREQMFEPFFTTRKSGTGLGLAVSYQIVEQHTGTFEVRSRPGRGTSITMTLPVRQGYGTSHEENTDR